MNVAFGLKAHSGWAALVVASEVDGVFSVVGRRRIELVTETWAKQPYHAAEHLERIAARELVDRGIASARRIAVEQMRAAISREREQHREVQACAVLTGNPLPAWTVDEILAVHFRMHKTEGVLFREVLVDAAAACGLRVVPIPEKHLIEEAGKALALPPEAVADLAAALGKPLGAPWGKDQKDAAVAALIALRKTPQQA